VNLNTYIEEVYKEVMYENPDVIFGKLESIEADIQKRLTELKKFV